MMHLKACHELSMVSGSRQTRLSIGDLPSQALCLDYTDIFPIL